ncbi:MAG: tRNA uridine-5-carboxymethylaminomethyl(34) synthesis GTPase MnmE [bacterium]
MNQQNKINQLNSDEESIIARCTPMGSGAIAILRICGVDAISIADKFSKLSSGKKLSDLPTHTIHHGFVVSNNETVDEVLFLLMHGPKTFTGQDTVEINCHNNPFIIEKIINQAIESGARLAQRGEFTKRAFLNKKIDLIQAESINEIIGAQTELALKKSMSQLKGTFSSFLKKTEEELIELLSIVEASFEFLEEEQRDINLHNLITTKIDLFLKNLKKIKKDFNTQQQIRNGIKIAIIGEVNVGKSTLFNSLLNKDRAIVTDIEGTTRDSVESTLYKKGNFWLLTDTAGLREPSFAKASEGLSFEALCARGTKDQIEKEGINRSLKEAAIADIVLFVFDVTKDLDQKKIQIYNEIINKYKDKVILVFNKIDTLRPLDLSINSGLEAHCDWNEFETVLNQMGNNNKYFISVSAKEKKGISNLEKMIQCKIQEMFENLNSPFLLNQRQFNLIVQLEQMMNLIVKSITDGLQYELLAYQLKEMLENLSELTGKNVTEKILDNIFNSFCVGK